MLTVSYCQIMWIALLVDNICEIIIIILSKQPLHNVLYETIFPLYFIKNLNITLLFTKSMQTKNLVVANLFNSNNITKIDNKENKKLEIWATPIGQVEIGLIAEHNVDAYYS